ncbi:hypothetical protein SAMN05892877_12184 [Rhizobium subbaraonis]|uniref:Uncharacterized protein n=1 Tax=Rhizobium subbaraonis TaxID=908946 RepID=A0A285UWP6_9HYPH|nr:hypothetical protein [Rhizobium subbaraonis]SOC46272.1 hypothetical protein SAMN05892877_12184 [Rhizobium subbaraonis]
MNQQPRDYAIRPRSAERDLSRLRIRNLEIQRNVILAVAGLVGIVLSVLYAFAG